MMHIHSARISVLLWAELLVQYALFVIQNYLTNVWKLSFTHAAAIVNIWRGISKVLPVPVQFLVDAFLGNFKLLVITSMAYSVGTGFLTMSTPSVFGSSAGSCQKNEAECIGATQKFLFHTGMALIAVGAAGHFVSFDPFMKEQSTKIIRNLSMGCIRAPARAIVVIVAVLGAFALPYIKSWSLRFGVPASSTVIATILFLSGSRTYHKEPPKGSSPLSDICRVFVAATRKRSETLPSDPKDLYTGNAMQHQPVPPTAGSAAQNQSSSLKCLDKAAIILPGEDQEKNKWRLCSVEEVEAAKIFVRLIPMWTTFVICGIVSSIGNTYFIEQANHMDRHIIGTLKIPIQVLLLIYMLAKLLFDKMVGAILKQRHDNSAPSFGIAVAMIFSVLCCITAAAVETRRLNLIRLHGLLDNPDADAPMSMFWLVFQFLLLAGLDSSLETSVTELYKDQLPKSMKSYVDVFTSAMTGVGFMCSMLSVSVVGNMSESGGKTNWFQHSLNKSRLDRYYWVLSALSSVNLLVFILLASCYDHKKRKDEHKGRSVFCFPHDFFSDENLEPISKYCCCCCCCCCRCTQ